VVTAIWMVAYTKNKNSVRAFSRYFMEVHSLIYPDL
jgi:hypothetical protein